MLLRDLAFFQIYEIIITETSFNFNANKTDRELFAIFRVQFAQWEK